MLSPGLPTSSKIVVMIINTVMPGTAIKAFCVITHIFLAKAHEAFILQINKLRSRGVKYPAHMTQLATWFNEI